MVIMNLRDTVLSDRNIYNAIYALRSYTFEKGLLSDDDVDLYHRLSDKYDFGFIQSVISECRVRIKNMLQTDELFEIEVYFKLKKYDEETGRFSFRPIHTASLIDQICMMCMLMPLMFNDKREGRHLSELSKLIPHSFYGNLPSTKVDEIFVRWQTMYKKYSELVIAKSQECKDKHLYKNEVCLDLKDFFPSINPAYIYDLVREKLILVYKDEDTETLEKILTKLLYFHIKSENIEQWKEDYYPQGCGDNDSGYYTNRGIAQGLPQAYFFGNLMMLRIAELVEQEFPGEAFYYVDDSVVFTNEVNDKYDFVKKVKILNKELADIEKETVDYKQEKALARMNANDREAQKSIPYGIKYHEEGKSFYVPVEDSYSGTGGLQYLTRQVSLAAAFSNNVDDVDDRISIDKLSALIEVIDEELKYEKDRLKKDEDRDESQIKLLKRHRKYFLYRLRYLSIREDGYVSEEYLKDFNKRYQTNDDKVNLEKLEDTFEEEIFQTECHMIIDRAEETVAKVFVMEVSEYEFKLSGKTLQSPLFLYYTKDLQGTNSYKYRDNIAYKSLRTMMSRRFGAYASASVSRQKEIIDNFLITWNKKSKIIYFPQYARFIMAHSDEFVRKVYNAFFSTLYCIDIADRHNFSKNNNRCLNYVELRIIAYLRNRFFTKKDFDRYVYDVIQESNTMERMKIDMALMEVLHVLIATVKNPLFVDNIILTHRLVSGLWKNGSKFLNAYTLHNEDHAITLIHQCVRLLKVIDYIGIKQNDYYVLFLACYLHDISMVIHPNINDFKLGNKESEKIVTRNMVKFKNLSGDKVAYHEKFRAMLIDVFSDVYSYFENDKRSKHPKDSAAYIKEQHDKFLNYIDDAILEYVALVSESHGYDAADVYGLKSNAKNDLFSVKYMMVLIRLADLMDMANDRVNYYRLRQNLDSLSEVSKFHWISHLITDRAYITASYKVDKTKRLTQHPITESVKIKIFLNVEYSATLKKKDACTGCQAVHGNPEDEGYTSSIVNVTERSMPCSCHTSKGGAGCPIICGWMMNKNWWLLNELLELKRYLNFTNNRLFNTEMEIDLLYKDTSPLDSDMFDTIRTYLEK